jgi:hypothetical protein
VALPFTIFKKYLLKAKQESWKFKYFTMQKYNFPKKSFKKETHKILQDIIITLLGCMQGPHISTHGSQGTEGRGEGSSQSRITESSMCGHQLFYISR